MDGLIEKFNEAHLIIAITIVVLVGIVVVAGVATSLNRLWCRHLRGRWSKLRNRRKYRNMGL